MVKNCLAFIFFFSFCILSVAQPMKTITYETKLEVADKAAMENDYYSAIEWYEKAYEESKDPSLLIAIADLQRLSRDYTKAEKLYDRVLKRDKNNDFFDVRLDYGRALKAQGKYKDAMTEFNKILNNENISDSLKMEAKHEIKGIELTESISPNIEVMVDFLPGSVNNGGAESSPFIGPDDKLYFSSFNMKKEVILDGKEGDYHAKIYSASPNKEGKYESIDPLDEIINRPDFHHGGVSFSRDGKRMYFTRTELLGNGIDVSKIFVSYMKDNSWSAPIELENVNGEFRSIHPIVGELYGQEVLFFSSDMKGGLGGYDLYYSNIKGGDQYGLPTNLGPIINTDKNEESPFYKDGTLYFSSNGHPSLGGYDIYYASWNGSSWQELTNIGYSYNTSYDDRFLRFDEAGVNGFLVSNRTHKDKQKIKGTETCCDDIYQFRLRELVVGLEALVNDAKGPLKGANIELYDLTLGGYPDTKNNPNSNKFSFSLETERQYKVIVTRDGYFPDSTTFNTVGIIDDYTVKKNFTLKVDPDWEKKQKQIITINEPIRLNNIYYDYDKWNILPDAERDLEMLKDLMDQYDDMVIELSSHTDSRGNDAYNQSLSQKRAESAKAWLVKKGVKSVRIKAVGYGEKFILNECKNGVTCADDQHRVNRRTEFKIISGPQTIEIKKEVFKDQSGENRIEAEKKPKSSSGRQSIPDKKVPIISFKNKNLNIGTIKRGESKEILFEFTNTGTADLIIELATTCKCTDIEYPTLPIPPGGSGYIKGVYHSKNELPGKLKKTIDIFSNTDPIVVEARFHGFVEE